MRERGLPLIVLGGSDRRPPRLPAEGRGKHPITGYKGVDLRIGGRPLVELLFERLRSSGAFGRILVAGPAEVYRGLGLDAEIVDTNASFGSNIRASIEAVHAAEPGTPIAFTTCDILPDIQELLRAMEDYRRRAPCDIWFPVIRAPRDPAALGASAWKPRYALRESATTDPVEILPSHLVVADPDAIRRRFVFRLLDVGYGNRNRPILYRLAVIFGSVLRSILVHDLGHLLHGRRPTQFHDIVVAGFRGSLLLRSRDAVASQIEDAARSLIIRRAHRDRYPERRFLLPFLDGLSLALDIDTEEEAIEKEGALSSGAGS